MPDPLIVITNELAYITEELRNLNSNFIAAQAPPVPGRLTQKELHALLGKIQNEIEQGLMVKTGWGRNEIKQLVAQVMWNTDLGYKYKEDPDG